MAARIYMLGLYVLTSGAIAQMFSSTVRSEQATSVEIDDNGNVKHIEEEDTRPPLSELQMPDPSISYNTKAPIVIVSIFAGPYDRNNDVWRQVASNHEEYAEKHGYGYIQFDGLCVNRSDPLVTRLGDASWDALLAISDAQKRVQPNAWIFWMDPDSSFSDMKKKLADFIPREEDGDTKKSLVITGDTSGFTSGHFFIRADKWSEQFLTEAWSVFSASSGHLAQDGMAAVLGGADPEDKDTWQSAMDTLSGNWWHSDTLTEIRRNLPAETSNVVQLVEFRSLASDSEVHDPEDFIVHTAGKNAKESEKILREM